MQSLPHERMDLPVTPHGTLELTNWVVGTVADMEAAQACARAFTSTGIAEEDLLVESAATALQQLHVVAEHEQVESQNEGRFARLVHGIEESFTERTPDVLHVYLTEAKAGRVFVGARDAQGAQIDRIRNILVEHGASYIHRFDTLSVRRLG
jgi:hypothetical protein